MEKNQNKSAFPEIKTDKQYHSENGVANTYGNTYSIGGLTKREYFAAMAMQGILAGSPNNVEIDWEEANHLSKQCVVMADELLKQLEQ